jgi:hypothetical protein
MTVTINVLPPHPQTQEVFAMVKVQHRGRIYACRYADSDTTLASELTEAQVRRDWRENRRAFLPYNEVDGCYV